MKKGKLLYIHIGILAITLSCTIQSYAQRILTLDEVIATTLQNNYDIQIAKNDSLVASIDYTYRNAVFLPNLNATGNKQWNQNSQKQTLADGSERKSDNIKSSNLQGSVALNWVLFDGFKMFATRSRTEAALDAGIYAIKEQIVNKLAEVMGIYYNIARMKQQVKATNVQIDLNKERAKLAQNKLDIGTGAKPDVLQSKVDWNAQKSLLQEQLTAIEKLKEQLVQAMNSIIKASEFDIPEHIDINQELALADYQEGLLQSNPTLLRSRANINVAKYMLKEAEADKYPTFSFNSAYNYNRTSNQTVINQFSPLFNRANGFNYGFSLNIPIFNQFNVKKQIQKSKVNVNIQELILDNQLSQLNMAVINAYKDYDVQKRNLKLEEENIELAKENVDIVLQTYKLGMATLVQLREAQLSLAQGYDRLINARYNIKLAEIELLRLKGDVIK